MRKHELSITSYTNQNGANTLYIDNLAFYPEIMSKTIFEIVNKFIPGNELFVGLYKIDGVNMSRKDFKKIGVELEEYFKINNNYYLFTRSKNKNIKIISNDLIVCKLVKDNKTSDMLLKFSKYFLETIFFSPIVDWNDILIHFKNYAISGTDDYVIRGFSEYVFAFSDSGDFSITFDPARINRIAIEKKIRELIYTDMGPQTENRPLSVLQE